MITEDFNNKLNALFPQMTNADSGNTTATGELWKGVSEKYADGVAQILAPVKDCILDVQTDLQIRNADACPVVQVEVIESMGSAMIDGTSWDTTNIKNKYVDVKLHRVSRPFKLTAYDIMKGERIESKVKAAMEAVANGVFELFTSAAIWTSPNSYPYAEFSPEVVTEMSGNYEQGAETLILNPTYYSKLIPTNGLGLDPKTEGVYGFDHIYKCAHMKQVGGIALGKNAIAGAVATPEILFTKVGQGMQFLGEVAGIPMVLISEFDYKTQTVMCSVETLAGFTRINDNNIFTFVN